MENLGHFIWIVFTFPLWVFLSVIWLVGKFLILLVISFFSIFKYGFSFEDLILIPFRLIVQTLADSKIVYEKFSDIYYEKSLLMGIIFFIMIIIYASMGASSRK